MAVRPDEGAIRRFCRLEISDRAARRAACDAGERAELRFMADTFPRSVTPGTVLHKFDERCRGAYPFAERRISACGPADRGPG